LRVRIDTPDGLPPLRAGMSVEVDVDTGHARGLPTFLARALDRLAPGATAALARPGAG
jgi:membrane fusion protein, multidrug efflux system